MRQEAWTGRRKRGGCSWGQCTKSRRSHTSPFGLVSNRAMPLVLREALASVRRVTSSAGGRAAAAPQFTSCPSAGSYALIFSLFLATLAATCAVLGRSLPFPEVPRVREKLEFLAKHGDDYDVIFIGSSQV